MISKVMGWGYPAFNPLWKAYYPLHRRNAIVHPPEEVEGDEDVFVQIYRNRSWFVTESVSGMGSTMQQTAPLRRALPRLVAKYGVKTFFDAPCGDFHWMQSVDLGDVDYIGADLVPELIAENSAKHSRPGRRFEVHDIVNTPPPAADLWMCRDVLFHLTNADAIAVLRQFATSQVRFLLSTTYPYLPANVDLERNGGFRTINLCKPPFNLPRPIEQIDDFVAPYTPRVLGLWSREQVARALDL
jgi:hypothetical protein